MKAILEFDFDGEHGIEDEMRHKRMLNADNLFIAVSKFDSYLRSLYKHQNKETIGTEEVRNELRDYLTDHGISLDDLI